VGRSTDLVRPQKLLLSDTNSLSVSCRLANSSDCRQCAIWLTCKRPDAHEDHRCVRVFWPRFWRCCDAPPELLIRLLDRRP
jgi:hypothetical protein